MVTPIFKECDKAEFSNYRPISALPVITRVFEKLIATQLYQHLNNNGYFSSEQLGFLRLHSIETSLVKSTDDLYNWMDVGKLLGVLFIYLKGLLTLSTMLSFAKSWKTIVFEVKVSRGLGPVYPLVSNLLELIVLTLQSRKLRLVYVRAHLLDLFYFLFTSMICQGLSKFQGCPCLLRIRACTTSLAISLC